MTLTATNSLFLNRELSWLDFNERVLHEATDERTPLLERLRFIAILSSNLDEFYMVRVAGLRRQMAAHVGRVSTDGMTAREQVELIDARVRDMVRRQIACLEEELLPALADQGSRVLGASDVRGDHWATVDDLFDSAIFPVLTPLAVDPSHPFPYISNLSLSLAVELRDPVRGMPHFARVKVPKSIPRWIPVGDGSEVIPVEQVIGRHLGVLFPGMSILGWWSFRVTRYSDIDLATVEEPEDLLEAMQEEVFRRRFGEVVRLEIQDDMPEHLQRLLLDELNQDRRGDTADLAEPAVHPSGRLLDLGDLYSFADWDRPKLRYPPHSPRVPPELGDEMRSIFDAISDGDVLVHHPFDSFTASVERFFDAAATDPDVLAIKTTLYRTSGDTAIVRALTEAAQRGKQVAVIVELKARFDEENNIGWARMLEAYGVHVSYGDAQLKTHTKAALVVRREAGGIKRYVHLGTGNYDSRRSRLYTDIGLFTCDATVGADASDLFNSLTGVSGQRQYRSMLVAPGALRDQIIALIDRETLIARSGRRGRIVMKVNALADPQIIEAMYIASQGGVDIDLIVRGICSLRPGVETVSERIRVSSIVGRFLEHSRLWYFHNDGREEFYIGSADLMQRNLDRRVEAVLPIQDASLHPRLHSLVRTWLADDRQAWDLAADGTWTQRTPGPGPARGTHEVLLRDPWGMLAE